MPKIPTYSIQNTPTSQPGQVLLNADSFTAQGRQLEVIGKTIGNVSEGFGKMQDMRDRLSANTEFRTRASEIKTRMAQDPNAWDNQSQYLDELNEAKTSALAKSKNTMSRLALEDDLASPFNSTLIDMRSHARTNLNNNMVINLRQNVETLSNTYVSSSNPLEIRDAEASIRSNVEESIRNGFIDAKQGTEYLNKTLEALPGRRVEHDIDQDPHNALINLKSGAYEGLKPGDKTKYEATAMEAIKRNQKIAELQVEANQTKNSIDVVESYLNGSLNRDSLAGLVIGGQVSDKLALSIVDSMNGVASVNPSTKADLYVDLMRQAYSQGSNQRKVVESAMAAHAKGDLDAEDLTQFLTDSKMLFSGSQQNKEVKEQIETMRQNSENAIKIVDEWVANYADGNQQAGMNILKDYKKEQSKGTDPMEAIDKAISAQINKDYPETVAFGGTPHVVIGKNSKAKYIFMGNSNIAPHRIYEPETKQDK